MRGHLFVALQWKVKGMSWSHLSFFSPDELSPELLLGPGVLENPFRESANLHLGCSIDAKAARTSNRKSCRCLDKQTYPPCYIHPPAELLAVVTHTEYSL